MEPTNQEKLLLQHGYIVTELTIDEFAFSIFAPQVGDTYFTPNNCIVRVVEVSYYKESKLAFIKSEMVDRKY